LTDAPAQALVLMIRLNSIVGSPGLPRRLVFFWRQEAMQGQVINYGFASELMKCRSQARQWKKGLQDGFDLQQE